MAALAEKWDLSDQELAMVTSVDFVTGQAVLLHGRVLKCERSSFFGVTIVAKVIDGIGFDHPRPKGPMDFVAVTAFYPALFHRVMRLFILLGPDVFVTGVTDVGLLCLCPMNGMATVARDTHRLVPADIPGSQMF